MLHKPMALSLPEIVDCRRRPGRPDALAEPCGGDLAWDNPYGWRIEYQAVYYGGAVSRTKLRCFAGRTEADAVRRLTKHLAGFTVIQILIWEIHRPATAAEMDQIRQLNHDLERIQCVLNELQRTGPGRLGRRADDAGPDPESTIEGSVHSQGRPGPVPAELQRV